MGRNRFIGASLGGLSLRLDCNLLPASWIVQKQVRGVNPKVPLNDSPTPLQGEGWGEGSGGEAAASAGGGGGCLTGQKKYTATRFEYAKNGDAVTYLMGEQWCWDQVSGQSCTQQGFFDPTAPNYTKLWAREFRYDGARARYMNRPLNTTTFAPLTTQPTVWSDYDGDEAYGDFTVASVSPWTVTNTDQYEPGAWRKVGGVPEYLHNDHLGTLRAATNSGGTSSGGDVFTAFGERISGTADRFGYVGAFGYQSTLDSTGAEVFPYAHVGARYYDPSSGRQGGTVVGMTNRVCATAVSAVPVLDTLKVNQDQGP